MISFKEITSDNCTELLNSIVTETDADMEYAVEIGKSFAALSEEGVCSAALAFSDGCLLVRIFDMGRYSFIYPIAISERADTSAAVETVRAYAVWEELPLCFTDVPREELGELMQGFRHARVDTADEECESFSVEIENELMLLDESPETVHGELTLSLLSEDDIAHYGALCRDEEVNRYWGYRYTDDNADATDEYFVTEAMSEYRRCVSLPLAVRLGGILIGEAVLHAFDYRGGAELGFRLAGKWQGKGFGKRTLEAAIGVARRIGLVRLRARVMRDNERSICLMSQYAEPQYGEGAVYYELEL